MNVVDYKIPPSRPVYFGRADVWIDLVCLSQWSVEQAMQDCKRAWAIYELPPTGPWLEFEFRVRILSYAIVPQVEAEDIKEIFYQDEIQALFGAWTELQDASTPDSVDALNRYLMGGMADDEQIIMDGARSTHCKTPMEFYDKPMTELTDGQILYYQTLLNAFTEIYLDDDPGTTKYVSRKWLKGEIS